MKGEERRTKIVSLLESKENSISGRELAALFHVSRQVIVQDIALLRAQKVPILSTPEGYLFEKKREAFQFSFLSTHNSVEEMKEELEIIVDFGGKLLSIEIEHEVYGLITASLLLQNRFDIAMFLEKLESTKSKPLSFLTDGLHSHTVEVSSLLQKEQILKKLQEKHFLSQI